MTNEQRAKAEQFRRLHADNGTFLAPNAWNAGSARMLEAAGFPALSTTSAGIALSLGVPDYEGRLGREEMMKRIERIARAVDVPVSADLEGGYGPRPKDVAETIRQSVEAGVVGGNIDDYTGQAQAPLFDIELAVERIRAAREAADKTTIPYTLTARTDCYISGRAVPLREAVRRANRYREAGADCIVVPGVVDHAEIVALVQEIEAPINGVDSFFEIRKLKPDAKIVMMTGFEEAIVTKALEAGAAGLLNKPFDIAAMLAIVEKAA